MSIGRDRLTWSVYSYFALWGWMLYSFGPAVSLIRDEQGTSRAVAGLHGTGFAVGSVAAAALAMPVARWIGRRGALLLGPALGATGVIALAAGPGTGWTIASTVLIGAGGTMALTAASPVLADHHRSGGATAISEGNGIAAGIGMVAPAALGVSVALGLTWRGSLLLAVPLAVATFTLVRRVPTYPALDDRPSPRSHGRTVMPSRFWPALGLLTCCVAVEFSTTYWTADLLQQRVEVSAQVGTGLISVIIAGMAVGRALAARLTRVATMDRLLLCTIALAACGWLIVWTSTDPRVAVAGLLLTGLGLALQVPLAVSRMLDASAGRPDAASGWASMGGGLASGLAPFALGALADAVGPQRGFLIIPVLLATAVAMVLLSRERTTAPALAA